MNNKKPAINLIFPHQLHKDNELLNLSEESIIIEEYLFFNQYNFHKQKLAFHRATMQYYKDLIPTQQSKVTYIEAHDKLSDIRLLIPELASQGIKQINCYAVTDTWLAQRMTKSCTNNNILINWLPTPLFINTEEELKGFFKPTKKKFYQTSFYKAERTKRNILIDSDNKPTGGKWTYDTENRKKYPKKKLPPMVNFPETNKYHKEAQRYVSEHFGNNIGELDNQTYYPTTHKESAAWLQQFLEYRFHEFGPYEDAIVSDQIILNHSVLTPMLNVGLLCPKEVLETALSYAYKNDIPINSLEGFVRQIMGWREFIRGVYITKGTQERTTNFWKFTRKIPASFYDGTTGIEPIDDTIQKILKTGYCHHIERLMILGNFMVLCEFDPNEVYRWFMELFIDAYDWVMVPNVYGMSQYADGGLLSTKPYISGSNYIMKMSNYKKGNWQETWDGLFWRFMNTHRDFFKKNPRLGMLVGTFDKMPDEKKERHIELAETYLSSSD